MFSESNEQMVERYADEFDGQALYEYCRILCYKNGERPEHRKKVFVSGKKAIEDIRGNARLYGQTVSAGIDIVRGAQELPIKYDGNRLDKEDVLSECAEYGKNATLLNPEGSAWYHRYATVLELQGQYDEAEEQLRKALELQLDRGGPTDHIKEEIDELNKNRQRHELEKSIERADERLTTIDADLSRVETELDETTNQYRSDFIQFIGFFAAILTIALTSVQIATTLTFPQSGGLILVLVGGITISFGELKILFGNSADDEDRNWRPTMVGTALIVMGLGVGIGLLDLLSF
jgi:tetratricopeptide (TPR) repeat protein